MKSSAGTGSVRPGSVLSASLLMPLSSTCLKASLGLYYGRLLSFICAVLTTWVLNRHLTFSKRASGLSLTHEFSRYLGLMLGGGVVNYVSYALLVYFVEFVAQQPVWGVAVGSVAGMMVNYLLARFFIFRGKPK